MSELLEQIKEKVQVLVDNAEDVAEEAEDYLDEATAIDNAKKASDPRDYVPLDDLPYGEECARLRGSPNALRALADELQSLPIERLSIGELSKTLEDAEERIEDVKSTISDCTPLPPKPEDEDGEFPL
ncbi:MULTISPECIES: hypothetical protein [Pseudomonas]|uniref:Uncharacterized protein n=1 Tax=Pseudomonas fluorescens ICMP 11288 TaxID=1198309 RepID=A0A0W0HVM0_PSEFL|nr:MULTISPECIES: hypothetical protein [Pseudomonas]KTB65017.1 hypothetical protein AO063_23665 [Pseudomonas fluorescens ICMP 11288]